MILPKYLFLRKFSREFSEKSFRTLSAMKKHGKAKNSSKKDDTDTKPLSKMKVQKEVFLSNCL